ncbi:MAG: metal transporter [Alteromonadaceae bacterium]|nr:MAG: metal transporter [Alteromonadaceae bacterium]
MKRYIFLFSILKRHRATRHLSGNLAQRIVKLLIFLLILVCVNSLALVVFDGMAVGDAFWLSSTTVTTVGYGDLSPSSWQARAVTVVCMYLLAITVLSLLIAETVDWRVFVAEKKRKGQWEWKSMPEHIQIINTPNEDAERYLVRLVKQIQITPELAGLPVQVLTRKYPDGLPESLTRLHVLHRSGIAEDADVLKNIGLDSAKYVIILARDANSPASDSSTFDILCRIRESNESAIIIAESVSDENKARFVRYGANVVMRPVRAYPEMIVRFLAHPGTEAVLENLFEYNQDFLSRIEYSFENIYWKDIVARSVAGGAGTPLAYINAQGVQTNPDPSSLCSGSAVISMVSEKQAVDADLLSKCLKV